MNIKKLSEKAVIPTKGSSGAAGYDLYTTESYELKPGERKSFKTDICLAIPNGFYGRVAPRSGLAVKYGIDVLAGVIDSDYRGEILVALINLGDKPVQLPIVKDDKQTAIAQIIFESCGTLSGEFIEVENLDDTERGSGGFGSTDTKDKTERVGIGNLYEKVISPSNKPRYEELMKQKEKV
jgi:dUTP pyrophosphatase